MHQFFEIFIIFNCVYVFECGCWYAHMSTSVTGPRKAAISSRVDGTGSAELPSMGAENQIQILCKSSTHSTPECLFSMYAYVCMHTHRRARAQLNTHTFQSVALQKPLKNCLGTSMR